ncbi:unnamed protein product [Microthlaspi erraticum]|uniref:Uncharacterized protein n=1 Tax=Microthlaspi erraticum TaxID=1685480 RepID=A0A6D2KYU7_9BRAS|nr:unnamed protein product [Microthlaspi erraticum]
MKASNETPSLEHTLASKGLGFRKDVNVVGTLVFAPLMMEPITEQFDELYNELDDINNHVTCMAMDCDRFKKQGSEIEVLKE